MNNNWIIQDLAKLRDHPDLLNKRQASFLLDQAIKELKTGMETKVFKLTNE